MSNNTIRIDIKVHPGASKNEIIGFRDDVLNVKITARPEKGKANAALIKYLGDVLDIAKSRIEIKKGTTSRTKTIEIDDMDDQTLRDKLLNSGR